jgi:hypothetical protein
MSDLEFNVDPSDNSPTVFKTLLEPLLPLLQAKCAQRKDDAALYRLSLEPFVINLLFAVVNNIKSISLLVTEINCSPVARALGLVKASKSMYSEAFVRYRATLFRRLFHRLLEQLNFLGIAQLQLLGRLVCVDGSIIPAIKTMSWATYSKTSNALKIHLAFELNRMIPVQLLCTDANTSERKILAQFLEAGVTYIADRGYLSFRILQQIRAKEAFFVFRMKANWKYVMEQPLPLSVPASWQDYIAAVTDQNIRFCHADGVYRLVRFTAMGEVYFILTNRFDLTTHEIILLYAYRWQIELFFRCIKRTFNAIHLWAHEPNGVEIQYYLYLIVYLLLLALKQQCPSQEHAAGQNTANQESMPTGIPVAPSPSRTPPACGIVTLLGKRLHRCWKIGLHWLTRVRNLLFAPFDPQTRAILST